MASVNQGQAYFAIADALGITLRVIDEFDHPYVTGKGEKVVRFGDMDVKFKPGVVSSGRLRNVTLVMVHVVGNLGLLVTSQPGKGEALVDLHVLNLAKMGRLDGWLETHQPKSVNDALGKLGKAVVRSFVRTGKATWASMA